MLSGVEEPFRVGHQPEHSATGVTESGDIGGRAVGVVWFLEQRVVGCWLGV